MTACRDCGEEHTTFLDGVRCEVERVGSRAARSRLTKFMDYDSATDLVALAVATEEP